MSSRNMRLLPRATLRRDREPDLSIYTTFDTLKSYRTVPLSWGIFFVYSYKGQTSEKMCIKSANFSNNVFQLEFDFFIWFWQLKMRLSK